MLSNFIFCVFPVKISFLYATLHWWETKYGATIDANVMVISDLPTPFTQYVL